MVCEFNLNKVIKKKKKNVQKRLIYRQRTGKRLLGAEERREWKMTASGHEVSSGWYKSFGIRQWYAQFCEYTTEMYTLKGQLLVYELYSNKAVIKKHYWEKSEILYISGSIQHVRDFPVSTSGKESICQCRWRKRHGFDPWVVKIPQRRAWQPTLVFLLGDSHGQRSLVGYSL